MKSIESILKKHGLKGINLHKNTKIKSPNNESRDKFKQFCADNNYKRVGNTNSFVFKNKLYGFCVTTNNKAECRQYSEHYSGFVCEMPDGSLRWVHSVVVGACTRKGPDGTKYFNATEA